MLRPGTGGIGSGWRHDGIRLDQKEDAAAVSRGPAATHPWGHHCRTGLPGTGAGLAVGLPYGVDTG